MVPQQDQNSSVQFSLSRVWLSATSWITAHWASLSITNSRSSLRLMSIESVMPSSHLILCRPLLLLPPIPPNIRVFFNESTLHMRWPKYWVSALASVLPKNTQGWSPSEWTSWISLQSKGLSRVFSNTTVQNESRTPSLMFRLWFPRQCGGMRSSHRSQGNLSEDERSCVHGPLCCGLWKYYLLRVDPVPRGAEGQLHVGFPRWLSGKESACQCRRPRFNSWVRKIPWREKWQPTPVFLRGKSHRPRSLVGSLDQSPWVPKE